MIVGLQLVVIAFCMLSGAFFSGMETGVISIHRIRLRHFVRQGALTAKMLQRFLDHSDLLLGTTLVGTNISVVVISIIAASLATSLMGGWGEAVSTVTASVMVLIFCEYLPKSWFHSRPLERCRRFAVTLRFAELVLRPVSMTVVWLTKWLVPGPSTSFSKPVPFVTREDLKVLAHEGEKDGMLSPKERVMIHRVFELSGKRAHQIMTPQSKMTVVYTNTTIPEFFNIARSSNFTRMPVYDRAKNKYVGIINVYYVLADQTDDRGKTVAGFVRPPLFIPEDMPVDDIFPRLRRFRQPMCLVTDEKSEVAGLITTEDILEEIVGQL